MIAVSSSIGLKALQGKTIASLPIALGVPLLAPFHMLFDTAELKLFRQEGP